MEYYYFMELVLAKHAQVLSLSNIQVSLKNIIKKIIILLNPHIEDNFRKNIFNPGTLKTKKVHHQCLGDKYLGKIKSLKKRDFTQVKEDLTDTEIDNITRKVTIGLIHSIDSKALSAVFK